MSLLDYKGYSFQSAKGENVRNLKIKLKIPLLTKNVHNNQFIFSEHMLIMNASSTRQIRIIGRGKKH